jgi:hypothetical protein
MTVPKHLAIHRHVENSIGIGKSTAHDTNDGDDDGLQRFSNWGGVSPEMGDVRWARNIGSTRLSTCDAGPRPEPPASPRLFRRFSSHPPSVHLRHKAGRRSACNTLDHFLRLLRFMRTPRGAWLPTQLSDSGVGPTPQPAPFLRSLQRLLRTKRIKRKKAQFGVLAIAGVR